MATLISTPQDLDNIRNDLTGTFELTNDIDMSGWGNWTPIDDFGGSLDGKGYKILNLSINHNAHTGLFGITSSTFTILYLGFENIDIVNSNSNAGALIGYTSGSNTIIDNCFVEGGTIQAYGYAGGLIGNLRGTATVTNSYTNLDSIHTTNYRSSGFIGAFVGDNHLVENCYSVTNSLTSADPNEVFGFAWYENNSTVNNCFWDTEVSGVTQTHHGTGKTTAEMQTQSTYTNWDFTSIWGINGSYPYLQVFGTPEQPAKQESREVTSYLNIITSQLDVAIDDYVPPKIETRSIQSDIQPISSHIQSHRATLRSIEGYLSRIDTNATQSSHIVRVGNVTSFVSPIQSSVNVSTYRQPIIQTINLVSYLNRIQADTDVYYHLVVKPLMVT
ncbi:hypothetical protein [Piscibacillus salipiscarius]|uniref:hypothetical protein n=1 Tax=Piscibacillus salipiscarius TaxID=299480 RepID=UPI0006D15BA0|nr:hypothetical protein [Piscibacillus salipiscarius]